MHRNDVASKIGASPTYIHFRGHSSDQRLAPSVSDTRETHSNLLYKPKTHVGSAFCCRVFCTHVFVLCFFSVSEVWEQRDRNKVRTKSPPRLYVRLLVSRIILAPRCKSCSHSLHSDTVIGFDVLLGSFGQKIIDKVDLECR